MTARLLEAQPYNTVSWSDAYAVDLWLDRLESDLTAISQRRLTRDQLCRYGRLLARADDDVRGVGESLTGKQANGYTGGSRVELQSDRLRREASPVLNPLVAPRSVIEVER